MTPEAVISIARDALATLLWVAAPTMLVALIVGLVIALLQALTSIQEVTLTFVPKIIIVFVVLLLTMPLIASEMQQLSENVFNRIAGLDAAPVGASAESSQ